MNADDQTTDKQTDAPAWRSDIYGLLHHPVDARVWLVPVDDGWSLPHTVVNEQIWPGDLARVTSAMRRILQREVVAYRYTTYLYDEAGHSTSGVYVLEQPEGYANGPDGGQWHDCRSISTLAIVPPEHQAVLDAYLAEWERDDIPSLRPPWARPGWFRTAEIWIEAQLAALGYTTTAPIEQVRCWSLSCVLRVATTTGTVYFKTAADLPLFANEPALLEQLSQWYPDYIPQPLCIERRQRWMLLADWGKAIGWEASNEDRESMYRTLARLQVEASARADQLLAVGCMDRRLHVLAAQIDQLFEDERVLSLLAGADSAQVQALAPRLKAMCDDLASYHIPYTLVHGDLHPGNVALRQGNILIFDWTDANVTHPFFDLMHLFNHEAALQTTLRESYFEAWTEFEPIERLREAWTLAAPLCALHHTISYHAIINNTEAIARDECASGLTFYGRKLLELMPA